MNPIYTAPVVCNAGTLIGLLKDWLVRRGGGFSASAEAYGLPAPKGLLIVGISSHARR